MVTPGQTLALTIDKPAAGGRMIARADGQVVLVAGAIPGEQVLARIERVGRGVAFAEVVSVDVPSPYRRDPGHDPLCGGCLYAHVAYEHQLTLKAAVIEDAFGRLAHLALPQPVAVAASPEAGYRMRARLHGRDGHIGFFREGTHDLCDPRGTRQLRDDTCDLLDQLGAGLRSLGMTTIRGLELSENLDASQRAIHLDLPARVGAGVLARLGATGGITGLSLAAERGRRPEVIAGDPHVVDQLVIDGHAVIVRRHVLAFFQANRFLLAPLVAHVMEHIGAGDRIIDLYAGSGLFSVAAAIARRAHVVAVEGDPAGAADLAMNAVGLDGRVAAVHAPVEAFVAGAPERPAVVIVDPPRTGMSNEALQGAAALRAPVVVYVSCDVATLARDAAKLVASGYVLERVTAFDLFPNTPHVEAVATFRRPAAAP